MVSDNSDSNGSRVPVSKPLRYAWCVSSIVVAAGFPLGALYAAINTEWSLTWEWVALYTGGVLVSLFAAFGLPVAALLRGKRKP